MKKNISGYNQFYFMHLIIKLFLWFSVVLFAIYLVIPLFAGKVLPGALIICGSWIGMAFIMRYNLNKIQRKTQFKLKEVVFLTLYTIICIFLWFPFPLNIFFVIFVVTGDIVWYKNHNSREKGSVKGDGA